MRTGQRRIIISDDKFDVINSTHLKANQDQTISTSSASCSNINLEGLGSGALTYAGSQYTGTGEDLAGTSVAIGDVNNDGYGDMLIGARGFNAENGAAYLVLGSSDPVSSALSNAIIFTGSNGVEAGYSVALGDVNGDGYADILVGGPLAPNGLYEIYNGVVYLILGSNNPISSDLSDAISFTGSQGNQAGSSVAIGDVNGDGYGDMLIGAPNTLNNLSGEVNLVLGSSNPGSIDLSQGIAFSGSGHEQAGWSVAVGDVNDDGYEDMLIGAPYAGDCNGAVCDGAVYLVLGSSSPVSLALSSAITFNGSGFELAGASLAIGDVNGDSYADMLIGAPSSGNCNGAACDGAVYLVLGSSNPISLALLNSISFSGIEYGQAGSSVALGDVNSDGYGDILIGAPEVNEGGGAVYQVLGSNNPTSLSLSGLIITHGSTGDFAGVVTVGDVNGDHYEDILIGTPSANSTG